MEENTNQNTQESSALQSTWQEEQETSSAGRKQPSLWVRIASIVMLVCILLLSLLLAANLSLRYVGSDHYVKDIFATDSIEEYTEERFAEGREEFSEELSQDLSGEDVSRTQLDEILDAVNFSDFLTNYAQKFVTYIVRGGQLPVLEMDDVISLIQDNEHAIEMVLGVKPGEEAYAFIRELLSGYLESYNDIVGTFVQEYDAKIKPLHILSSNAVLIGTSVGIVVLFLGLIIMYKCSGSGIYQAFRCCAVPMMITGIGLLAVNRILLYEAKKYLIFQADIVVRTIERTFSMFCKYGWLFFGFGIVCIAAAIGSYAVYRSKSDRQ